MKIQLVSAGNVITSKSSKGIMFFSIKDGKIDETDKTIFSARGLDYPVGWIIEVNKKGEHAFGNFKVIDGSTNTISEEFIKKYSIESALNSEEARILTLRRSKKKLEREFNKMTIGQLKDWCKLHPHRRRDVIYYILGRI